MLHLTWLLSLCLGPQAEDAAAAALLKAVQEQVLGARTLRVGVAFAFSEREAPVPVFTGELRAKGEKQWLIDFMTTRGNGLEEPFRASCDGLTIGVRGLSRRGAEAADGPQPQTRQLRSWSATSFMPLFVGLGFKDLNLHKNNLPVVGEVIFLRREKVGKVDAQVIHYDLNYPGTRTGPILVTAWIDPARKLPLKREVASTNPDGGGFIEMFSVFELEPETPDTLFVTAEPTEAEQWTARLRRKGLRQISVLTQALGVYQERVGRYPAWAEGLEALLRKPAGAKNGQGPPLEDGEVPNDPWGNAYVYRFPGVRNPPRFDLFSPDFADKYKLPVEKMKDLLAADIREAEVVAALKSLVSAQLEFRSKDRDGNGAADFWAGDVSGLYRFLAAGSEIRLIDRRIAEADASALRIKELSKDWPEKPIPYHGYLFSILTKVAEGGKVKPFPIDGCRSTEMFRVAAYPANYPKDGRYTLLLDAGLNVLRCDLGGKTLDRHPSEEEHQKWRLPPGD